MSESDVPTHLRRLLVVAGILSIGALAVVYSAHIVVADVPDSSVPEDNETLSLAYSGAALVHIDDYVYAWRRQPLDVTISLDSVANGSTVCLYRRGHTTNSSQVGCERIGPTDVNWTRSFRDAGYGASGPTVYQFEVRVFDTAGRELASTRSRYIVQITNWSALNEDQFDEYVTDTGLVNVTGGGAGDTTGTTGDSDAQFAPARPSNEPPATPAAAHETGKPSDLDTNGTDSNDDSPETGQQAPRSKSVGENTMRLGAADVPGIPFSELVVLLSGGGMVALVGLLYIQRRRGQRGAEPAAQQTHRDQIAAWEQTNPDFATVMHLLVENDGRVKQSAIVEATDWSKAKVSRILSRMAAQGHIHKQQDGRRNIIVLRRQE